MCHFLNSLVATFLLGLASVSAAGEIYEWVDENGVTQFSQTPPTDQNAEAYQPKDSGTLSISSPENAASTAAKQSESEAVTEEAEMARIKEELEKEKERMKLNCDIAKHNLNILSTVGTGKFKDENGEVIQLTAEQHAARKTEAEGQIEVNCGK